MDKSFGVVINANKFISSLNFAKRKMSISILETIKIMMKVIYINNLKKYTVLYILGFIFKYIKNLRYFFIFLQRHILQNY